ncbi:MAG: sulfotransferase domain-containing protein [Chthoniobacterales bacterium]
MSKNPDFQTEFIKAWRLLSAPMRALPDFILPGAPKCGTSSMYDCIAAHPQVRRSDRKEPTNFIHYPTSALRSRMHFPFRGNFKTGEGSVEYFTHPDAPANIHAILPHVKLIFLFRDPVQRAWSDYQMFVKEGHETESFPVVARRAMQWLNDPDARPLVSSSLRNSFGPMRYVANGLYWLQAMRWLDYFDRKDCLFLLSEDFFAHPKEVTSQVYRHLSLPKWELPPLPVARMGDYKEKMDPEIEAELKAFFAPHNKTLAEFLGRDLIW